MILLLISFVAGVLTALAPCIISLLPVIIGGSLSGDRSNKRAFVVTISLGISVILFTLLLKASTIFINVPPTVWQGISGVIIVILGFAMVFPKLWDSLPLLNRINRDSNKLVGVGYQKQNFFGDVLVGAALGPVFASCSPTYFLILATVLPASFALGLVYLIVYAIGLSLMLLLITLGGQKLLDKLGVASDSYGWFKRTIGVLFILVGLGIFFGIDKQIQVALSGGLLDTSKIERYLIENQASDGLMPENPSGSLNTTETPIVAPAGATPAERAAVKSTQYPKAPEIVRPSGFVNTDGKAITLGEFKGKKVVLVDFWTYSCINCIRTTPYLNAWYEKYKDQGLEIVSIHTPEFAFEQVLANVQKATTDMQIKYPVVLDNDYATWGAFKNQYWPRKYLVDIDGFIIYDHAGEGEYEATEKMIQKALAERAQVLGEEAGNLTGTVKPGETMDVDFGKVGSPETYFGSGRNELLANGTPGTSGVQSFAAPENPSKNKLYFGGVWNITPEYAESKESGSIVYRYKAKNVYLVMSSKAGTNITILIDGKPVTDAMKGADVKAGGVIRVQENRLYRLIEGDAYEEHTIEIKVDGAGLEAFAFTFG